MKTIGKLLILMLATSLTACGKFANSNKDQVNSLSQGPTFKLGALGDSITRGYDISALFKEDTDQSWSTGLANRESILNQLIRILAPQVATQFQTRNFAVTGQSVNGSNSLFQAEAQQMAAFAPQVVTIEIGANDICQGLADTTEKLALFQQNVSTAIDTLKKASRPPVLISVATVPNIYSLTQIPQLASQSICQNAWALACPNLATLTQAQFQAQWTAVNQALEAAAKAGGNQVVFDNYTVANTVFTTNDVSALDCFHPSATGQGKLANAVWSTISSRVKTLILEN